MSITVTITFDGLDEVIGNLGTIGEEWAQNVDEATAQLGVDALEVMKEETHIRSGRLRSGDTLSGGAMAFELSNPVYYAPFVERGHMTPRGWRTRHGYRPAKHPPHHVAARPFLEPAVEFVEDNILDRLGTAVSD